MNRLIVAGCPGGNVSAHARGRQDLRHSVAYEAGWRTVRDPTRAASPAVAAQLGHSLKSAAQYTFRHLVAFPVGQEQEGELNFKFPPPSASPPPMPPELRDPSFWGVKGAGRWRQCYCSQEALVVAHDSVSARSWRHLAASLYYCLDVQVDGPKASLHPGKPRPHVQIPGHAAVTLQGVQSSGMSVPS